MPHSPLGNTNCSGKIPASRPKLAPAIRAPRAGGAHGRWDANRPRAPGWAALTAAQTGRVLLALRRPLWTLARRRGRPLNTHVGYRPALRPASRAGLPPAGGPAGSGAPPAAGTGCAGAGAGAPPARPPGKRKSARCGGALGPGGAPGAGGVGGAGGKAGSRGLHVAFLPLGSRRPSVSSSLVRPQGGGGGGAGAGAGAGAGGSWCPE
ncbi:hypothetical protein J1605_007134 [Eschrichtius robustus]|uniref:Uncharacterized protein n=1 Tax=Eschrichtius robustus TaxID=9764 RepID=A0AB34GYG8_ESCRO|nr:hypothetical protein J1605_007134 [Eschrichtius robustus]